MFAIPTIEKNSSAIGQHDLENNRGSRLEFNPQSNHIVRCALARHLGEFGAIGRDLADHFSYADFSLLIVLTRHQIVADHPSGMQT